MDFVRSISCFLRQSRKDPPFPTRWFCAITFFLLCFSPALVAAKGKSSPSLEPDYIAGLATANRFLNAWQNQDEEAGLIMLTEAAKRGTSEDHLQAFFVLSPAAQRSYEIARGHRLKPGRYSFSITLLESSPGHNGVRTRYTQIVVIRTGKDDWAVDKLP